MNKVFKLIRVFFKSGNSLTASKKKKNNYWLYPLLAICFLPIAFQLGFSAYHMTSQLRSFGIESIILYGGMIAGASLIFFFGIFYVFGVFYLAKDIEFVLTLPLKAWQILTSKFVTIVVYEYLIMLIMIAPILVGYGLAMDAGILYILYALLIFFILPVISLSIASIPILTIMRFTGFAKNRDMFKYFTGIFALILAVGVNVIMQRFAVNYTDVNDLMNMIEGIKQTVMNIGKVIPGLKYAVDALTQHQSVEGLLNLLIYIAIASLLYMIFMLFGNLLYFKGVIGINESSAKRQSLNSASLIKKMNKSSKLNSYVLKEMRLLIRTPIYFLNCILANFIIPVVMLIPMISQGDVDAVVINISRFASENGGLTIAAVFAVTLFVASSNGIAATAISREGTGLYIMKYLPVPIDKQVLNKVKSGVWISVIAVIIILGLMILLKIPVIILFLSVLTMVNGVLFPAMTGIIFDMHNPKLLWDNEQAAVKQNVNVIFNLLVTLLAGVIAVVPTVVFSFGSVVTALFLIVIFGIVNQLLYQYIRRHATDLIYRQE